MMCCDVKVAGKWDETKQYEITAAWFKKEYPNLPAVLA